MGLVVLVSKCFSLSSFARVSTSSPSNSVQSNGAYMIESQRKKTPESIVEHTFSITGCAMLWHSAESVRVD